MYLCRTCLSAEDLRDIFTDADVNRRKEELTTITGVKISPNDGLPQKICNTCSTIIDSAIKLRETSVYAEKMLIQNGFQYSEQKLTTNKEKSCVSIKDESDSNDNNRKSENCDLKSKVKHDYSRFSDLFKSSMSTKKELRMKKNTKKYKAKCTTRVIPESSTYNVVTDTIDMLTPLSDDEVKFKLACAKRIETSVDVDIQKIIHSIESQDKFCVKRKRNKISDITKSSRRTKKDLKWIKNAGKRKEKCFAKAVPESSTYNIDNQTLELLAPLPNDNAESTKILNSLASMIPNDPSVDGYIPTIINNIESQDKPHSGKKPVTTGELKDIEKKNPSDKSINAKGATLEDELLAHLNTKDNRKEIQKKAKSSSLDLDEIYNIIDTKIDTLSTKKKTSRPVEYKTIGPKPGWSAERLETLWALAVHPLERNERVECNICHKFTKYHCFTRHAATHFEPEFTCEVCGLKLMSKKNLADHHQRKHGATKNFACAQCDYRSVLPAELQNHIRRVHTGERPFICDLCSESFYQRRCLVAHMKCHFAEKKYQCDRCSNMFKSQGQLTAHYNRYHIMRYTFYCDHCSYQVSKSSKVKDHLTKVHGIPRDKQTPIKFFKERREESLYGETNTKHLRKPEEAVKKLTFKY